MNEADRMGQMTTSLVLRAHTIRCLSIYTNIGEMVTDRGIRVLDVQSGQGRLAAIVRNWKHGLSRIMTMGSVNLEGIGSHPPIR
jgi:hypothetical protein